MDRPVAGQVFRNGKLYDIVTAPFSAALNTTTAAIAAPAAGKRLVIFSFDTIIEPGTTTELKSAATSKAGPYAATITTSGPGQYIQPRWPNGLECGVAEALNVVRTGGAAAQGGTVEYIVQDG